MSENNNTRLSDILNDKFGTFDLTKEQNAARAEVQRLMEAHNFGSDWWISQSISENGTFILQVKNNQGIRQHGLAITKKGTIADCTHRFTPTLAAQAKLSKALNAIYTAGAGRMSSSQLATLINVEERIKSEQFLEDWIIQPEFDGDDILYIKVIMSNGKRNQLLAISPDGEVLDIS